jgi:hypothetical protein
LPRRLEFAARSSSHPAELERALEKLASTADAVFLREPAIDPSSPDTSDLDLIVFGRVDDLLPERMFPERSSERPIDLIWLPSPSLDDPEAFARQGVLPHRLLSSKPVHDPAGRYERQTLLVERAMFDPRVQGERIAAFLDLGFLTVREIGITRDFPALALFWLHMAYAALVAALGDATRTLCPNVYTRPFDYASRLEELTHLSLVEPFLPALHLRVPLDDVIDALWRVHRVVADRFPEPSWSENIRQSTRYEYRYFLAREEVGWRVAAASEMARRGSPASALFYLRLLAYSLARVPSVHRHALDGEDASFLRPRRAIGPQLRALCPEIMTDLGLVLGDDATGEQVGQALEKILRLKAETLLHLESRGIRPPGLRDWSPFHPAPRL